MKRMISLAAMVATAALSAGGCASLPGGSAGNDVEVLKLLSDHAAQCDRKYQGGLGVGASFTFAIDCKAAPQPAETDDDPPD
ncbi:MAG: hypothetical protein KIS90_10915 [Phenylobacterium sp.]|nr:hypothetical protein [Phenylobacterium sp.]